MKFSRSQHFILLLLLALNSALLSDKKSIFSITFEAFAFHCKQIKKLSAEVLKSGDYSEIINLNEQKMCCSLEIANNLLTHFNTCVAQNDKDPQYPQLISLSNESHMNEKCIQITFYLFCEHISHIKFNTKWNYNLDQSMNSCINSFIQLFNSEENKGKENVIFIQKGEPLISHTSENILMRSFESEKVELKCIVESFAQPYIQWLRNNQIIPELYNKSNEFTIFEIKTEFQSLCKTTAILEIPVNSEYVFANYTCNAINSIGKTFKTFTINEIILLELRNKMKVKRFNITGFVIGMCPPMLISFYIIIKLGYRSRYAQERTDDNGHNEEPFFVSN